MSRFVVFSWPPHLSIQLKCRINVFKLRKEYPKLLTSAIGLGFFNDYNKGIKAICEENEKGFQC